MMVYVSAFLSMIFYLILSEHKNMFMSLFLSIFVILSLVIIYHDNNEESEEDEALDEENNLESKIAPTIEVVTKEWFMESIKKLNVIYNIYNRVSNHVQI